MELVKRVNRKLASEGKVVGKTRSRNRSQGEYYLLDSRHRSTRYLGISELKHMAMSLPERGQ